MVKQNNENIQKYLGSGEFINSDHPDVIAFTLRNTSKESTLSQQLIDLYYAVRDQFRYDPYALDLSREAVKASSIVNRNYGYCVEKSCLFAAGARVLGIPSRMGFSKVRNHIGTEALEQILKTDVLVFHGYTEVLMNEKWIKTTPVFNKSLCDKLNVMPLEFDGVNDAIFQAYDREGGQFMEYLHDYGTFSDVPYDLFISELNEHYPHLKETIFEKRRLK